MNNRERFLKTMHFEEVDHPPFFMDDPWDDTLERWYREGYPKGTSLADYFKVSPLKIEHVGIDTFLIPPFKPTVLEEDDEIVISTDCYGAKLRTFKKQTTMPEWLEYGVKTDKDLEALIERLTTQWEQRIPPDWGERRLKLNESKDAPVCACGGSYYGILRNLMGVETVSMMLYDSPDAIRQWLEAYHRLIMQILEKVFAETRVDYLWFGEDFAYRNSSLISPSMYRELIQPKHKMVTDFARARGVDIFFFDSDGNLNEILPDLLAGGINLFYPIECAADMDPIALRWKYGKKIRMIGGLDKREIAKGKEAIKRELCTKVPRLIKEGGFIPRIDHSVSSDISLENFTYYFELIKEIYGVKNEI